MAGAGGKNDNITGVEFECATALATEPNFDAAACYPKHFVNS